MFKQAAGCCPVASAPQPVSQSVCNGSSRASRSHQHPGHGDKRRSSPEAGHQAGGATAGCVGSHDVVIAAADTHLRRVLTDAVPDLAAGSRHGPQIVAVQVHAEVAAASARPPLQKLGVVHRTTVGPPPRSFVLTPISVGGHLKDCAEPAPIDGGQLVGPSRLARLLPEELRPGGAVRGADGLAALL
eukprot:CAMPEP_0179159448 /NCGR_PEP_ID=MMETSP0796-20121207/77876_1 /TAXON_ID=73915 /ORGANISM="Pyrodinium bahamense, Strain pbaha01" /LENGTH=186 /DNA_ID=CAMNT_0020861241 /DNA_START=34 /DNA_END=594 /DNA_ORIENTATION=-